MRVSLRFAWYDMWIGMYVDRANRRVHVCPLPCLLITFARRPAPAAAEPTGKRLMFSGPGEVTPLAGIVRGVPYAAEHGGEPLVPDENGMIETDGGRFWIGSPPAVLPAGGRPMRYGVDYGLGDQVSYPSPDDPTCAEP